MRNKKYLLLIVLMLALLVLSMGVLAACDPIEGDVTPPVDETPKGDVTLVFTPDTYVGDKYNGQSGTAGDTYIANLKASLKVDQGEAKATFVIKSISIKLVGADYVAATAEELAKFTLLDTEVASITTTATDMIFKVQYGDFSAKKYFGADFRITIEGQLSAIA